jgi:hypothetical protein
MTPMQTLAGIAVVAIVASGAVISVQTTSSIRTTKPAAQPMASAAAAAPDRSTHSCSDMNGKAFGWSWSNVPFASTCDARPDAK